METHLRFTYYANFRRIFLVIRLNSTELRWICRIWQKKLKNGEVSLIKKIRLVISLHCFQSFFRQLISVSSLFISAIFYRWMKILSPFIIFSVISLEKSNSWPFEQLFYLWFNLYLRDFCTNFTAEFYSCFIVDFNSFLYEFHLIWTNKIY